MNIQPGLGRADRDLIYFRPVIRAAVGVLHIRDALRPRLSIVPGNPLGTSGLCRDDASLARRGQPRMCRSDRRWSRIPEIVRHKSPP